MTPETITRYQNREASLHELAREERMATRRLRAMLEEAGVAIRPKGRPSTKHKGQGHRGKQDEPVTYITPRYSCTHHRVPGHEQCPRCDRCQCGPKRRGTGQKYGGLELCRCGRLIGR